MRVIDAVKETIADVSSVNPSSEWKTKSSRLKRQLLSLSRCLLISVCQEWNWDLTCVGWLPGCLSSEGYSSQSHVSFQKKAAKGYSKPKTQTTRQQQQPSNRGKATKSPAASDKTVKQVGGSGRASFWGDAYTPYASGREISEHKFGNACQRKEIGKRMTHLPPGSSNDSAR